MNKETESVLLYAEGPNPSGRDIQNLTGMMEIAIVISYLNTANIDKDRRRKLRRNYRNFLNNKYNHYSSSHNRAMHHLLGVTKRLLSEYRFLGKGYDFDQKFSKFGLREFEEDLYRLRNEVEYVEHEILEEDPSYIRRKSLTEKPEYYDVNEWIATEYGCYLLPVQEVKTTKSIEILFNVASVAAILGFQNVPQIKDMVLYAEAVFKDWMGRAKVSNDNASVINIPHIPASVERTISKYDDVEISSNKNGWTFKLKRNGNNKVTNENPNKANAHGKI